MTACVSGPDYHLPANAVAASTRAAQPFVSGKEASFSHDAPPDRWWQLYGDPQLDGYVREALAANTDLRAADANLRRASATALEYRARGAVQADVDASARSPMPVATPRRRPPRSRTRWAFTSPIHWILQVASAAASKPPTPTRRPSLRCATRSAWSSLRPSPVPISRCAPAITRSRCNPAGAGDTARHAGGNPSPGCRRAGTDFDVSRAGAAVNRSAAAIPHLLANGSRTVRTGRIDGQAPGGLSQGGRSLPTPPGAGAGACRSVMVGSCSSGAPTYVPPSAALRRPRR